MKPQLTIEDSIWTTCNKPMKDLINFELSYNVVIWKKIGRKKKRITYRKYLIEDGNFHYETDELNRMQYYFDSGFVPRVMKFLKKKNVDYDCISKTRIVEYDDHEIEGIDYRYYQKDQIETALTLGRGVIKSATGTGKSYDIMGLIRAFSEENILFLADAGDILTQLLEDILKVVPRDEISYYKEDRNLNRIHISTVQTLKNILEKIEKDHFDVIIVDEVDKVSSFDGMFAKVLTYFKAPVKLGVTATIPNDKIEARWALEGLIGPMISEYTIHQAAEDEVLSKPIMHFVKSNKMKAEFLLERTELKKQFEIAYQKKIKAWKKKNLPPKTKPKKSFPTKYQIIYWNAVVTNIERNNEIATIAENIAYQGGSVLISVIKTKQGKILEEMISGAKFIYGNTPDEERKQIKSDFESGKLQIVIASVVWQRGISVSRISCYIKGEAGKSETAVVQWAGRPLRMDEDNKTFQYEDKVIESGQVLLVDFDDSNLHKYLKDHTKHRKNIYRDQGWIK